MISLFRLFSFHLLKQWALFIVGSIVGTVVLSQFFKEYGSLLALVFYVGFIFAVIQMSQMIAKNLNWVMALPLSKRKILGFNYLFSIFIWIVFIASSLFVAVVVAGLKGDLSGLSTDKLNTSPSLLKLVLYWSKSIESEMWLNDHIVGMATIGVIAFTFFHASCMAMANQVAIRRMYFNLWNHVDPKRRQLYQGGIIGAGFGLFAAYHYFSSEFGQVLFWCSTFTLLPALNASVALSMGKKQRSRLIGASVALAVLQVGIVHHLAVSSANNNSSQRRIASILFLGPFGQGVSKENIAKLLEGDLKQDDFSELSKFYLENFYDGKRIRKSQEQFLHFDTVLNTKKTESEVMKTVALFNPAELEYNDIKILFEKLATVSQDRPTDSFLLSLLSAKMITNDLVELLKTKNTTAIRYALIRSRYDRDPSLIPIIQSSLPEYKDDLRLAALKTLSVLYGQYIGLDGWVEYRNGRSITSVASYFNVDCNNFTLTKVQDLNDSNLPALNLCLRQKVDRKNTWQLESIESAGWVELPLDTRQTQTVKQVFRIH